jgi:hypothetical protein
MTIEITFLSVLLAGLFYLIGLILSTIIPNGAYEIGIIVTLVYLTITYERN